MKTYSCKCGRSIPSQWCPYCKAYIDEAIFTKDWCLNMVRREGDLEITAGVPDATGFPATETFTGDIEC